MTTRSEIRTYEIVTTEGRLRMEIPESWKVTYAPVQPGGKGYGASEPALRVYENDTKQRAIFLNVLSFRDLSIPVQRLLVSEKGKDSWKVDENGRKRVSSVQYDRKWVSEDEIDKHVGADAE